MNEGHEADADLTPVDFSAIRPSANRARFDLTARALAAEMTAARSAATTRAQSDAQRTVATLIAWQRQIGLAAAVVMFIAGSALLRTPRTDAGSVARSPIAQNGVPLRLAAWSDRNYRPTAVDLIAAFSSHLNSPLFR
jgi:hypothetical protein